MIELDAHVDFDKSGPSAREPLSLIACGCPYYYVGDRMATGDLKALLGAAIKAERSALGISQEELAYRAGLHRTYVSDLERGARNPSLESVEKLARALELSVPKLFERRTGDAIFNLFSRAQKRRDSRRGGEEPC